MRLSTRRIIPKICLLVAALPCVAATFGTIAPVRGTVSDIALDERRGRVYAANFSASQIEVMNTSDLSFGSPMPVPKPPSAVAMSPDNRFLVVAEYAPPPSDMTKGGFTIFDLDAGQRQDVTIDGSALAVAFGAGSQALMVTSNGIFLIDPLTAKTSSMVPATITTLNLPVKLATFPPQILQASSGVSGDGKTIVVLATNNTTYFLFRYSVTTGTLTGEGFVTTPKLGPTAVAVDQDGTNVLAGWLLLKYLDQSYNFAQIPNSTGVVNIGTNGWDLGRNVIYAQQVVAGDGPVLHVLDTDNLTVRERLQLPQNLAGRSLISSDDQTMYAVAVSGVAVLPIGRLGRMPQIGTLQEDLVFQGDACNRQVITQTLDVVDFGNAGGDFTVSLPAGTKGVRILNPSGKAPSKVQIQVDPVIFQAAKGTTVIPLTITSSSGVNLPFPVRLLINTRDLDQRGTLVNIPGKIVDMLADPSRNRLYLIRQDKNLVLVYDTTTLKPVASLRTGNTPVKMSITTDQNYLIVGNDNSQIANVFDLQTLQPSAPILFPFGHYPRAIGVTLTGMFATERPAGGTGGLDRIDFANRVANQLPSLGIYQNTPGPDGVFAESADNQVLLLALPDGNVLLYDTSVATWVASRQDLKGLGGAYGALSDNLFLADVNILDRALVPIGQFSSTTGTSSGFGILGGGGLRTTRLSPSGPGLIERVDLGTFQTFHGTSLSEAPVVAADLMTPTVGLIGQTILPFTRTLAIPADQSSILLLTISGLTVLTPDFDAATQISFPVISSVTNSADGSTKVAPGGLVQIAGAGLAPFAASASGLPLPTALGDTCVTVNTVALPLFSVAPSQIAAQLPFVPAGPATVIVRNPGGISSAYGFTILAQAPAIFHSSGLATVVRDDNGQLVNFTNPLHPNQSITIYLTGMGTTTPLPGLGAAAPANPLAVADAAPTVTLGNASLGVTYAGLTPGEVGVYQINAQVPGVVQEGTSVALTITQGGVSTSLAVRVVTP